MDTLKICNDIHSAKQNILDNLGYEFKDESILLLSLIHSSYRSENEEVNIDNEKLEFIGDAVLDLIVSNFLFKNYDYSKNEGDLTIFRSKIVRTESLSRFSRKLNLGDYLIVSASGRHMKIMENKSVLADAFEALVGAIYLDSDFETTCKVIIDAFSDEFLAILNSEDKNFKGLINEYATKNCENKPFYEVVEINGPVHDRTYTCAVIIDGNYLGTGSGHSIKNAEQQAAKVALKKLGMKK